MKWTVQFKELRISLKLKQEEMSEVTVRKEMAEKKLGNVNKDYELTIEKLQVSQTGHRYNIILIVEVLTVCCWRSSSSGLWSHVTGQVKVSKGVPRQAEVAQGVPGRLRPRIFLTFQHYKGGWSSAKCTGLLYPRRNPWYSLSEAESTSGHMVLLGVPRKKSPVTPPGIDPGTIRLVVQRLNHYATPGPTGQVDDNILRDRNALSWLINPVLGTLFSNIASLPRRLKSLSLF